MTDKERYKRAFSLLRASDYSKMEVKSMNNVRILPVRRLVALCAAVALVAAMASVAYAADLGGVRRTIQLWVHGDQTNAVLDIQGGSYSLTYQDGDGTTHQTGGGGVAIEDDGKERPLTEEEILDHLDMPEVVYQEDGTIWVYFRGQKLEITDKFVDDVCYVQVKDGSDVRYLTVTLGGSYTISPYGYEKPNRS